MGRKFLLIKAVLSMFIMSLVLATSAAAMDNNSAQLVHTVKSGDSLWKISKKYGVSVDKLKQQNNLTSDMILVGQQLLIRSGQAGQDFFFYTVKPGDTPWLLSQHFQIPLN